ncbi:hypothetical protein GKZ68_21500 (plasmid) [Hymenobacter sp. BRD128]|uniref:hypothetical protein n=1 Tax=Hymenobacter sp. BRD128 TaxID=2675878 RepID=UPI0015676E47|nr:hypothetical protein [Hymenobacter sp. BRD128]QKG59258.1 hypothetical protein GKZ68_21500 [Hymenobacter sp. BRD128]
MRTLLLLLTGLILVGLALRLLINLVRHRPIGRLFGLIGLLGASYGALWLIFFLRQGYRPVALGTDVCFDDWCATVTQVTRLPGSSNDRLTLAVQVLVSNHGRGRAQTPSYPRLHILDQRGQAWAAVGTGPIPLATRLQAHESKAIRLVYKLPLGAHNLTALLEEGPWLTHLLLPEDQPIFVLP